MKKEMGKVLFLQQDMDPYCGSAVEAKGEYILDCTHNSVVYDMGEVTRINRAELFSVYDKSRVSTNFVALYASLDNETYEMIPAFCMINAGSSLLFFNFSVEARYLKVHFTYTDWANRDGYIFKHEITDAMVAYFCDRPIKDGGKEFAKQTAFTVENATEKTVYDRVVSYTLDELGIKAKDLKADLSDIRFRAEGYELPHFERNGRFYVRVMEIPAKGSVTVTVLYGNKAAENISCGEATLEIEYGTKTVSRRPDEVKWRNSVTTMPEGSLLQMGCFGGDNTCLGFERSTDGGHTWTRSEQVPGTETFGGGGFLVDYENNAVFYLGNGSGNVIVLRSDDSGKSWNCVQRMDGVRMGTYSDGAKLSTFDGDGPNVDYVFPVSRRTGVSDHTDFPHYNTSFYSRDGGKTWQISETQLRFGGVPQEEYWVQFESGLTEPTLWERKDGTLVMYSRYQGNIDGVGNPPHFLLSYSYDHGVTWGDTKLSTVFATNTQPILSSLNGVPTLLWGGNNSAWFRSYQRFPISIAYSEDDCENFIGIQDLSHQTRLMSRFEFRRHNEELIVTNPNITYFERGGVDHAYVIITNYRILVENFSNYLYKTKGVFDSFESGNLRSEGWVTVSGITIHPGHDIVPGVAPEIVEMGATNGRYAMKLGNQTEVSRSVPYTERGEVFFDCFIEELGKGTVFELQSAYNRKQQHMSSPVRLWINEEGKVLYFNEQGTRCHTGLTVKDGANSISIRFDGPAGTATVTVNGETAPIAFNRRVGAYVCFAHFRNGENTSLAIDSFGLTE